MLTAQARTGIIATANVDGEAEAVRLLLLSNRFLDLATAAIRTNL